MQIQLKKFGNTLISRPAGKESFLALQPQLDNFSNDERIEIDFEGVVVMSPSWADEFITPLIDRFEKRVTLINTDNPSVKASLETLKKARLEAANQ